MISLMTKKRILDICEEIDSLKDRFGLSDDDWWDVSDEIREIRKRCQDEAFYLGVVGANARICSSNYR